ncbi:hypothetical protein EKO04_011442 [Ascochyta lentis]|uniref:Uncharacterized protein n=1 Tax=Ascochyta lentis TaxID=205686 RepID=A0A8H7ITD9_9PLEO|nr:hypothetical protein EKO04_011442 [Ascochyta lentis]
MPKPAVKSPLQALENERLRIEAKRAEKTRGLAGKKVNQEAKKTAEIQEVLWLMDATRPSPPPLTLQLPNPPPRQNVSGRFIPLSLLPQDDSFPPTPAAREEFVGQVLVSMMDVREADDTISATTDFKNVWLKPALKQEFSYDVVDMERVCRELVSIAETLHTEGLGPTRIYCPRTIQKAVNAKPMSFKDRISKLSLLMRKSKSRCNDFMLGNTMEDTVALIEQKLADQKSNAANNKNRSVKLLLSNQLMGLEKGAKWSRTDGTATASFSTAGATLESLASSYGTFAGPAGFNNAPDLPLNASADFDNSMLFPWQNHGSSYGVGGSWNNSFQPGPDSRNPQDWPLSNDPPSFGDSFGQS